MTKVLVAVMTVRCAAYVKKLKKLTVLNPISKKLSDDELKAKTVEFRERLTKGGFKHHP